MKKKFVRKIGPEFDLAASQRTHMDPRRAIRFLSQLADRAIIEDVRKHRQNKIGLEPAVLGTMEHKALKDAIRLLGVRLKLLYEKEKAS